MVDYYDDEIIIELNCIITSGGLWLCLWVVILWIQLYDVNVIVCV